MLAAGAGRVCVCGWGVGLYIFFSSIFHFSCPVLWETADDDYNIVVSAVNRLEGLSLPRNSTTIY